MITKEKLDNITIVHSGSGDDQWSIHGLSEEECEELIMVYRSFLGLMAVSKNKIEEDWIRLQRIKNIWIK